MGDSIGSLAGSVLGGPVGGIIGGAFDQRRQQGDLRDQLINGQAQVEQFERITDEDGNLRDNLRLGGRDFNQLGLGNDALSRLNGLTNFNQSTPIADRLQAVQAANNRNAVDNINATTQGNLSNSISALASRGGIRGGARERLANRANLDRLNALQTQSRSNQNASLGIQADDANRQLNILNRLPQQALGFAQFDRQNIQSDIGNSINDIRSANQDAIQRSGALQSSLAQVGNTPKGGIGGTVSGILGK